MNSHLLLNIVLVTFILILSGCQNHSSSTSDKITDQIEYNDAIKRLQSDNAALSFDSKVSLSDKELIVQTKIIKLRQEIEEQIELFESPFYTQPFLDVKSIIDSTLLYHILRIMPKGGLLHTHSSGLTDIDWVIAKGSTLPDCYVYILPDNTEYIYGQLSVFKKDQLPNGFVSLGERLKSLPEFTAELHDLLILKRVSLLDSRDVWAEFEKRFKRISDLVNYRPFFQQYYHKAFLDLAEDGVQHVEIRMIIDHLYDLQNSSYTLETAITDMRDIVIDIQKEKPEFTFKLIYTSFKSLSVEEIDSQVEQAIVFKRKFPDIIAGFDLVAEEDIGNTISYYQKSWKKLDSLKSGIWSGASSLSTCW